MSDPLLATSTSAVATQFFWKILTSSRLLCSAAIHQTALCFNLNRHYPKNDECNSLLPTWSERPHHRACSLRRLVTKTWSLSFKAEATTGLDCDYVWHERFTTAMPSSLVCALPNTTKSRKNSQRQHNCSSIRSLTGTIPNHRGTKSCTSRVRAQQA